MMSTTETYQESWTCNPDFKHWPEVLKANQKNRTELFNILGAPLCQQIREEVIEATERYTAELRSIAQEVGISVAEHVSERCSDGNSLLIMSGHQPVVYHHGLLAKARAHQNVVQVTQAYGVHVVIDTDCGDSGELVWPARANDAIELARGSITEPTDKIFRQHTIVHSKELLACSEQIQRGLINVGLQEEADRAARALALYERFAGRSVLHAHTIVRWALQGFVMPEVPLSSLFRLDGFRQVLKHFCAEPRRVVRCYNTTLDEYRESHNISNKANPFPNLTVTARECELPLWRIEDGKRKSYKVEEEQQQPSSGEIVSRGSITTLFLRAFCCDLFVHGIGGAKYDRFVDEFAENLWGVKLPRFVVASATRYIAPERLNDLERTSIYASQQKEITARPQSFFQVGIFTSEEKELITELDAQRGSIRQALAECSTAEQRSPLLHKLNTLNKDMSEIIGCSGFGDLFRNKTKLERELKVWQTRSFPFFMVR